MREIKFRFWHKEKKVMGSWEDAKKNCNRLSILEIDDFITMQFTGLKDKNGKEIYEGDILQGSETSPKYDVLMDSGRWSARYKIYKGNGGVIQLYDREKMFEIIGNIYENKELLREYEKR